MDGTTNLKFAYIVVIEKNNKPKSRWRNFAK